MRHLPKVRIDLKSNFKEDQITREKLNYLQGGDGGSGDGNDDLGEEIIPPIIP
jgi:hypothetical protein